MGIPRLSRKATVEQCVSAIELEGCAIIEGLAGVETLDAVQVELDPYFERTPFGEGYFVGYRTKRMGGLIAKSPASRGLILQPTVLGIMASLLGPHCARIQLNLTQAIQIWPGEVAQVFHRDDELFPYPAKGCEFMVNALWAYDDFSEANGATRLVPGSHRMELTREPEDERVACAEMPRGSVLVYLGSAIHSGGANRSARPRTALTLSYSLGWLRQAENHYLAIPPRIARTLPEELQQLIGYAIHAPNLGWYEGQDPGVVLREGVSETLAARDYLPPDVHEMLRERHRMLHAERG